MDHLVDLVRAPILLIRSNKWRTCRNELNSPQDYKSIKVASRYTSCSGPFLRASVYTFIDPYYKCKGERSHPSLFTAHFRLPLTLCFVDSLHTHVPVFQFCGIFHSLLCQGLVVSTPLSVSLFCSSHCPLSLTAGFIFIKKGLTLLLSRIVSFHSDFSGRGSAPGP